MLLTVMQKEQHLVTAVDPSDYQLMAAMGLNCPDTADCDPAYAGFFRQVYGAAKRYRYYLEHEEQYGYTAHNLNYIQYHPNAACGGASVYREQGDRPALHLYALPAEHRRTGRWQRYRRFLLQLWQPQLRAYLHQLVRFAAKLITAADRSCPIGLGQHCQRSTYGRSRVVAPTASSEAKASRHRQTACTQ